MSFKLVSFLHIYLVVTTLI